MAKIKQFEAFAKMFVAHKKNWVYCADCATVYIVKDWTVDPLDRYTITYYRICRVYTCALLYIFWCDYYLDRPGMVARLPSTLSPCKELVKCLLIGCSLS